MAGELLGAAMNKAAKKAALTLMKKGKSKEQKKIIDFFYKEDECCGLIKGSPIKFDEYINMVQARCDSFNHKQRAMEMIGLDQSQIEEIPPIVFSSFKYFGEGVEVKVDDGDVVTTHYSVTWIFFSATQMYTYKLTFSMISDDVTEETNDFFYTDITNFSTAHKLVEKIDFGKGCGCNPLGGDAQKNNYTVDELEIIVPGASYAFSLRNNGGVERSIQAAKAMIREKKYSI